MQPGLAVARSLVMRGHDSSSIHFVGSRGGIEARLVPEAGFGVSLLPGRGLVRRMSVANIGAVWGLLRAGLLAFYLLGRRRPAVVVALGGYASVPCAVAAALLRVPIVVMEQNAVPGAANRLVGRFARACAVSFETTALPRATLTGNPVRTELLTIDRDVDRRQARTALGLPAERLVVAVFGGSLGARRINEAVEAAVEVWRSRADLTLYHVVGSRDWGREGSQPNLDAKSTGSGLFYRKVRYEDRMDLLFAAADLAVCRAGATSVAELAAVGLPSVLVPLPGAPGDHQTANASALVAIGAAVLIVDRDLDGGLLAKTVDQLLCDQGRLRAMSDAAKRWARPDAATRVADLVEAHARRPPGTPASR